MSTSSKTTFAMDNYKRNTGWAKANRQPHQLFLVPRAQQGHSSALKPLGLKTWIKKWYRNCPREQKSALQSDLISSCTPPWACVVFSFLLMLPDTVCSICGNRGSPKMTSLSLTTNNAVPFLCQTRFQPTSFQRSSQPLALWKHRAFPAVWEKLKYLFEKTRATISPAGRVSGQFLKGFMENLRKEVRKYKNRGRKK